MSVNVNACRTNRAIYVKKSTRFTPTYYSNFFQIKQNL